MTKAAPYHSPFPDDSIFFGHGKLGYWVLCGFIPSAWFTLPPLIDRIGGMVSLNWIYVSTWTLCVTLLSVRLMLVRGDRLPLLFSLVLLLFVAYAGISIIWADSPIDSLRYYPKLLLMGALFVTCALESRLDSERGLQLIRRGISVFLVISVLAELLLHSILWEGQVHFQGLTGRYMTKFYALFAGMFSLAAWFVHRKTIDLMNAVGAIAISLWILQRGTIASFVIGMMIMVCALGVSGSGKRIAMPIVLFAIIFVVSMGWLFFTEFGAKYMFYSQDGTDDFIQTLFGGDLAAASSMIHLKGRDGLWQLALEALPISVFGAGLATSAIVVGELESVGDGRIELHNDWLQYLLDLGLLGVGMYLLVWVGTIAMAWRYCKSTDGTLRMLALATLGFGSALAINSSVDHVLTYHTASAPLGIVAGLLIRRRIELIRACRSTPTVSHWHHA